ncbi:hypothetical protein LINJ_10_1320 [Leishmania infantum JPCM5]|uniref:Uncharacterized protein n=2 Tax=Leishmania donovani species complex TaxID=38574 RepID=E9AGA1_LEIIN|nr:hypothetical protein LINJ_10_1320 [Leishmania infantum JPCM5]XP_003858966.1 hypothetical protein LDBPK_101320 [Leishmania donovani]CBZ08396.1 hypothetical protein LINJ_10_1320 [Leishmania infantum JPCM5]CBZ32249.1 hypothetical protein LDBPK_101320 [Leishmania donovani]|eukprot:XP_003392253.1 hypothetical protein LINJ_10_1320 [Leishmania infantum JPCM5]
MVMRSECERSLRHANDMLHQALLFTPIVFFVSFQISRSRVVASISLFLHPPPWVTERGDTQVYLFVRSVTR